MSTTTRRGAADPLPDRMFVAQVVPDSDGTARLYGLHPDDGAGAVIRTDTTVDVGDWQ